MKTRRQHVLGTLDDLAGRFLYYDRKEDEDLPLGEVEVAVAAGEITVAEIIEAFAKPVREHLQEAEAQNRLRREKARQEEPKVPCGTYGCTNPKPQSAVFCDTCAAEHRKDPEAFK